MNKQEYFDKTVAHLLEMSERAGEFDRKTHAFRCAYVDANGNKCAVGCHMPDGHPAKSMSCDVRGVIERYPELKGVVIPDGPDGLLFARGLQQIHDNSENWGKSGFIGHDTLRRYGKLYGLDVSRVT